MSDVILYAAIKENQKLNTELLNYCLGNSSYSLNFFSNSAAQIGAPYVSNAAEVDRFSISPIVSSWQEVLTPIVDEFTASATSGFKVCDSNSTWRCGFGCAWVVPAGVCRAQFQLWGAGGGTSSMCCCGGAPYGPSGAYQVVQMDVTPGHTYSICAACAGCCYATMAAPAQTTTCTCVNGCGLAAYAEPGCSCIDQWRIDLGLTSQTSNACIPDPVNNDIGPQHENGWNFCWDSSNDDLYNCFALSSATWGTSCADPARNIVNYGINGLWPAIYIGASFGTAFCTISTPVFGFEDCVCSLGGGDGVSISTCAGCLGAAVSGVRRIPGAGGAASMVCGGTGACTGDTGRFGMVCVSYICS